MSDLNYTKTSGQLMDWTLLDDTGGTPFVETNELDSTYDVDTAIESILHVDMAHIDTNAAGSTAEMILWIKSGTTDEDWHEYIRLTATDGTANEASLDANSGASQANPERIYVAATANFQTPGDVYFLKDVGDLTNSAVVCNKSYVVNDYIIHMDDLVGDYDNADKVYDIVDQWSITLPASVASAKVTFHNQDADATYACRTRYTIVTKAVIV